MAGEGGIVVGGGASGGSNWYEDGGDFWSFGYVDREGPDYRDKQWLRKNVPTFSDDLWRTREGKASIIQEGFRIWRERKMLDPDSEVYRDAARKSARGQRVLRRQAAPSPPTGTRPPTQRTAGLLSQSAIDNLVTTLRNLYAQWQKREEARQAARAAKQQAKQLELALQMASGGGTTMSLGDVLSSAIGTGTQILTAAQPTITQLLANRAARRTGASGIPLADLGGGAAAMSLFDLLGQPGALEEGDILEALESDIEREVSLWQRPSGIGGRVTPVRTVFARHPQTGNLAAWNYAGKPVLFSGDLATCKRVNRIARRTASRVGLRFRRRGRR